MLRPLDRRPSEAKNSFQCGAFREYSNLKTSIIKNKIDAVNISQVHSPMTNEPRNCCPSLIITITLEKDVSELLGK